MMAWLYTCLYMPHRVGVSLAKRLGMKAGFLLYLMLLAALLLSGCDAENGGNQMSGKSANTFTNPVIQSDFPDPGILVADGLYYAYATNAYGKNIQAARSSDLVTWEMLPDALPALPSWASLTSGLVWAPDVAHIGDHYVMYYTARDSQSNRQCIGRATSDRPDGRFRDTSAKPFICQVALGGTIDASFFRDGDKLYLYFKNDGNCCGLPTQLWVQELSPDGLSLVGTPTSLLENDPRSWEGNVIEAPYMVKHGDSYYLFYSANSYADERYAVGYARCTSPTGPCEKAGDNPILASHTDGAHPVIGPGGQSLFQVGNQTWMAYHVWSATADGQTGDSRTMWLDRLDWVNGRPVLHGPTTAPQPMPLTAFSLPPVKEVLA